MLPQGPAPRRGVQNEKDKPHSGGQERQLEACPEVIAFTLNTKPYTVGVFVLTLKLKKNKAHVKMYFQSLVVYTTKPL